MTLKDFHAWFGEYLYTPAEASALTVVPRRIKATIEGNPSLEQLSEKVRETIRENVPYRRPYKAGTYSGDYRYFEVYSLINFSRMISKTYDVSNKLRMAFLLRTDVDRTSESWTRFSGLDAIYCLEKGEDSILRCRLQDYRARERKGPWMKYPDKYLILGKMNGEEIEVALEKNSDPEKPDFEKQEVVSLDDLQFSYFD